MSAAASPSGFAPGAAVIDSPATCKTPRYETSEPVLPAAQARWAATPILARLQVIRAARHRIAIQASDFIAAISPNLVRSQADTLVTELLPLLDAMRFLERRGKKILSPQVLGTTGRPVWLTGVRAEIQRVPLGHILVIAPANFPLFLAGVQAVQALVAGNSVTWKPGAGGECVARLFAQALRASGLPRGILHITQESIEAGQDALRQHPDKVIFTGSFSTGTKVLQTLAETATPAVMELSGADAVVVLPSADLPLVAKAVSFGLRLNGAEVCMSPRRLVATAETMRSLRPLLIAELAQIEPRVLRPEIAATLQKLADDAITAGATLTGQITPQAQAPLLVENAHPDMAITSSDLFAPVLSLIEAPSVLHMPALVNACPYALTAAVFGNANQARALGEQLKVGTVLVNDLIAPTADPRIPFVGRGRSGFGATRGAEGLLEMTAIRTLLVRRKGFTRPYQLVGQREIPLFTGILGLLHGGSVSSRIKALRSVITSGRTR